METLYAVLLLTLMASMVVALWAATAAWGTWMFMAWHAYLCAKKESV